MKISKQLVLVGFLICVLIGCEQKEAKRQYREITTSSPFIGLLSTESEQISSDIRSHPLRWTTPEGWDEQPGSGMRLATFRSLTQNDSIECSIVILGKNAGGLEANVIRWMEQVKIPVLSKKDFQIFLEKQKKIRINKKFSGVLIDFTSLQSSDNPTIPSMMAFVLETQDNTIFVKMTGSLQAVLTEKDSFQKLLQSFEFM